MSLFGRDKNADTSPEGRGQDIASFEAAMKKQQARSKGMFRKPWEQAALILLAFVVLLAAVAWPYVYSPLQVSADCALPATANVDALGSVQTSGLTVTSSFSTASVGETDTVGIRLTAYPSTLNTAISAGFEVRLQTNSLSGTANAQGIEVYRSDPQPLRVDGSVGSTSFKWVIPAMPAGQYYLVPFIGDGVSAQLTNTQVIPTPITIQSKIDSFAWMQPLSIVTDHSKNTVSVGFINVTGLAQAPQLTAQTYEGSSIQARTLKSTTTRPVTIPADQLQQNVVLTIPGLSDVANPVIVLVADFGNYKQYLTTSTLTDQAELSNSWLHTGGNGFLSKKAILSTCLVLGATAITKGSVVVRWYAGNQKLGQHTQDISTKTGDVGIEADHYYYSTNRPDRVEVDLLRDGHLIGTVTVNPVL